jgi:hypothetical protein
MILTKERRIVTINTSTQRVTNVALRGDGVNEPLAGFGRLPDGSLWTLSGWQTLVQIGANGEVLERRGLRERETGLHSGFDRLIYQPLDFTGGAPALVTLGDRDQPVPWGTLRVRSGPEGGPIRLAQSLASCGVAVDDRIPCWLSNSTAIEIVDAQGHSTVTVVSALADWVSPDAQTFANNPHRVIRDVWLQSASSLWLLVRGAASDVPDRTGERGLWHIDATGRVLARYVLPVRSRLIVGIQPGRVLLLTVDGDVSSVGV